MDAYFLDDDNFSDLSRYSRGSFVYCGEIYMSIGASSSTILRGLSKISSSHPDEYVRLKALKSLIVIMTNDIYKKHCK